MALQVEGAAREVARTAAREAKGEAASNERHAQPCDVALGARLR
jgi:hypothetical protein